ncbi:hypothetical protein [Phytoactinopolyspora mesophila]|uniref:Uncharacterized protein n=1 Tax=Phytoactinopolyspora mesophila TaxID=2650750 RepID=A0A7K3MAR0_9ACTN|nr:hypothetical protein [Phytoactinopolyspora mesophila]NDL60401.1 hypothetical protein [Phytoactinopolyspora mesophila]
MPTGSERYRKHKVWETLNLKLDALKAARYDDAKVEQRREDIVEWLSEAAKTKLARQPALYLSALDELGKALNELPTGDAEFKRYVAVQRQPQNPQAIGKLEAALRSLPLPPPKDLKNTYVKLLDEEIEFRTARLDDLAAKVTETEEGLQDRLSKLDRLEKDLDTLRSEIAAQRAAIAEVSSAAESKINTEWSETLGDWKKERTSTDEKHDAEAVQHIATLAATAKAGEALAEHAAGDLSAADWNGRATRERRAAQWIRAGAVAAFVFAGAVGWFIVSEAVRNDFDLTLGDGVLRSTVALVIGAFGALLLRESSRHFREADTAEDVALSLQALAPFYAGSADDVRLDARKQVGNAVLVKNVLSRFAHRDAAKHATEVNTSDLPGLVKDATRALKGGGQS